jgi:hypothetical protein
VKRFQLIWGIAVAAASLCLSACGGGGEAETIEAGTPPAEMLEAASLDGLRSGAFEGAFEILNSDGENSLIVHLASGFNHGSRKAPGPFFISIGSSGEKDGHRFEFNGRLFYVPPTALFLYGPAFKELDYVVGKPELKKFESKLDAAREEGGAADISACAGAAEGASLESLIRAPKYEGSTKGPVEGTRLFEVSGEVNVPALTDLLVQMAEDPACGAQMKAIGLPSPTELKTLGRELDQHAQGNRVVVGVDEHGLPLSLEATLDSASSQTGKAELKLLYSLREVNEEVDVPTGAPGKPLAVLLRKFGVEPKAALEASGEELFLGLLEGFGGGATGRLP